MNRKEWAEKYIVLCEDASWNEAREHEKEHPDTVWTEYGCDGERWIDLGLGYVNRIAHYIMKNPCEDGDAERIYTRNSDEIPI